MGSIPTRDFFANETYLHPLLLANNLVNWFRVNELTAGTICSFNATTGTEMVHIGHPGFPPTAESSTQPARPIP